MHMPHSSFTQLHILLQLPARMQIIYAPLMQIYRRFAACRMASQAEKVINTESSAPSPSLCSTCPALGLNLTDLLKTDESRAMSGAWCVLGRMPIITCPISLNDDLTMR